MYAIRSYYALCSSPTPGGVPVAITSPTSRVIISVMNSIRKGMSKIRFEVLDSCLVSPFTLQEIFRSETSISSVETIRITSYNVCYTKLLREQVALRKVKFISNMLKQHQTTSFLSVPIPWIVTSTVSPLCSSPTPGGVPVAITSPTRITSYNVCYTKLLRDAA